MTDRRSRILEIVNDEGKIDINTLAARAGVSSVTVRKDLDALVEKKLLMREHGFAVSAGTDDINNRLAVKYDVKLRIARRAAQLVRPGETVMIESGSTCALIANELAATVKDVTIITNSAFIAGYVREQAEGRVILLGGEYQKESQVMVGPLVHLCVERFHVDKLFAGTDGFDQEHGFTAGDMMRTDAMRCMAACARKVYVVTDAGKFTRSGLVTQLGFDELQGVITDEGIPADALEVLRERGVEVMICRSAD